jgi:hypothetical protein
MYSRAEMESCVSWVEEDEGAEDGASDDGAETGSAIAQSIARSSMTTNGRRRRRASGDKYSNQDHSSPVAIGIDASVRFGS